MSIRHKLNLMFGCFVVAVTSTGAVSMLVAQMMFPALPATSAFEDIAYPPSTTNQTIAWDPISESDPTTGLILVVSNAATNITYHLPKSATNQIAPCVIGTNYLVITSTNQFFASIPARTNWLLWNQAWVRPFVLASTNGTNYAELEPGPQRATAPAWFCRAGISNWNVIEGHGLPPE